MLQAYLSRFAEECEHAPGPISDSFVFGNSHAEQRLLIVAATHGNETAGIAAILEAVETLRTRADQLNAQFTFALGNPGAIHAGKRFVEFDMNRIFSGNVGHASKSREHRRAFELSQVIRDSTAFIDLHQTVQPTEDAFYIFAEHAPSVEWATALQAATLRVVDLPFGDGEHSSDQFAQSLGIPGIAIELGQAGLNIESIARARDLILNCSDMAARLATENDAPPLHNIEMTGDFFFEHPRDHLVEGLTNLKAVKNGQLLGFRADGREIYAQHDGVVFFPKYPKRDAARHPLEPIPRQLCSFGKFQEFTWRRATNADCAGIQNLIYAALNEFGISPEPNGVDSDLNDLDSSYFRDGGFFDVLVARDGSIVGTVGLQRKGPDYGELKKLFLHPSVRNVGHGRAAISRVIAKARHRGMRRLELETAASMRSAIHLYGKAGFKKVVRAQYSSGTDIAMVLDL